MKIAYFIMAHQKPNQLAELLNAIYDDTNLYLIHIDSAADWALHDMVGTLAKLNDNIHVLPTRKLTWGCWSLVQAELDAIRMLLNIDQQWDYYINLSGQDFPLVRQPVIKDHLLNNPGNYFEIGETDLSDISITSIQNFYFVEDCGQVEKLKERAPFYSYFDERIKPYMASQWKILNRAFAAFAADSFYAHQFQDYYRYTYIPDEHYFSTLFMNSDYADTLIPDNRRKMYMENLFNPEGKANRRPRVIKTDDLQVLIESGAFFARKFDEDVDPEAIGLLKQHLGL